MRIATIILLLGIPIAPPAWGQKPEPAPAAKPAPKPKEIEAGDDAFKREDWDRAVQAYEAALKKGIDNHLLHFRLGYSLHMRKRYEEALAHHLIATRIDIKPLRIDALYNVTCANARLGRKEEALKSLAKAIEAGFVDLPQVEKDSDLDSLRSDPAFRKLIESIGKGARRPEAGERSKGGR